jgi:hypothetical protein
MRDSSFEPEPAIKEKLAKGFMWSYNVPEFEAPTFQSGMPPAGSMYSTVADLGSFITMLLNEGRGPSGPLLQTETLKKMWEPQFSTGATWTFGIGFALSTLDGHRLVSHGGAIYGFATELEALPDDKLGVATVTTMDCSNAVTTHIAHEALRLMLAVKAGKPLPTITTTQPISADMVRRLVGRYGEGEKAVDLVERNGELYLLPVAGGYQVRLRQVDGGLIVDDRLSYGTRISVVDDGIKVGDEVLRKADAPKSKAVPEEWKGLIGEYGWDHDILYISERNDRLTSLIEWFEYEPLEQISRDVFQYPSHGLYDNEQFVFIRDAHGVATEVHVGAVVFKRRMPNSRRQASSVIQQHF